MMRSRVRTNFISSVKIGDNRIEDVTIVNKIIKSSFASRLKSSGGVKPLLNMIDFPKLTDVEIEMLEETFSP